MQCKTRDPAKIFDFL